ncbi:MAG: helix-turn-helix domain containing protein [Kiritimatiellae bacterium]|jgi:AcrR family transcriptional regulator|nr:helix-turn-helix domain containing protein [Kiritimatiellia bacterium]
MGIVIDHDARKSDIIQKSIQLFAEQGYNGVTFQKIADSCGIARTTLYTYFKNKREIFNYAIWDVSNILVDKYDSILQQDIPTIIKLKTIMGAVLELLFDQRMMLTVILDYILAAQRAGLNTQKDITSHTIALRRIIQGLIVGGMRKGELKRANPALATDLVYSQMETAILRLTISSNADLKQLTLMMHKIIESLQKESAL